MRLESSTTLLLNFETSFESTGFRPPLKFSIDLSRALREQFSVSDRLFSSSIELSVSLDEENNTGGVFSEADEHMFDTRDELLKDVEDEPESKHGAVGIGDK